MCLGHVGVFRTIVACALSSSRCIFQISTYAVVLRGRYGHVRILLELPSISLIPMSRIEWPVPQSDPGYDLLGQ